MKRPLCKQPQTNELATFGLASDESMTVQSGNNESCSKQNVPAKSRVALPGIVSAHGLINKMHVEWQPESLHGDLEDNNDDAVSETECEGEGATHAMITSLTMSSRQSSNMLSQPVSQMSAVPNQHASQIQSQPVSPIQKQPAGQTYSTGGSRRVSESSSDQFADASPSSNRTTEVVLKMTSDEGISEQGEQSMCLRKLGENDASLAMIVDAPDVSLGQSIECNIDPPVTGDLPAVTDLESPLVCTAMCLEESKRVRKRNLASTTTTRSASVSIDNYRFVGPTTQAVVDDEIVILSGKLTPLQQLEYLSTIVHFNVVQNVLPVDHAKSQFMAVLMLSTFPPLVFNAISETAEEAVSAAATSALQHFEQNGLNVTEGEIYQHHINLSDPSKLPTLVANNGIDSELGSLQSGTTVLYADANGRKRKAHRRESMEGIDALNESNTCLRACALKGIPADSSSHSHDSPIDAGDCSSAGHSSEPANSQPPSLPSAQDVEAVRRKLFTDEETYQQSARASCQMTAKRVDLALTRSQRMVAVSLRKHFDEKRARSKANVCEWLRSEVHDDVLPQSMSVSLPAEMITEEIEIVPPSVSDETSHPPHDVRTNDEESSSEISVTLPIMEHPKSLIGQFQNNSKYSINGDSPLESSHKKMASEASHVRTIDVPQLTSSVMKTSALPQPEANKCQAKKYERPARPCPFCQVMQKSLSRHISRKHRGESRVSEAMSLESEARSKMFSCFKKEGIFSHNKTVLGNAATSCNLMRERKGNQTMNNEKQVDSESALKMCTKCKGIYDRRYIWKHSRKCMPSENSVCSSKSIALGVAYVSDIPYSNNFHAQILSRMRDDIVGRVARSDKLILKVGHYYFLKNVKKDRHVITTHMRRLALLLIKFRQVSEDEQLSGSDMLDRTHFNKLTEALTQISEEGDACEKSNLKMALGYLLKKAASVMQGVYLQENNMKSYDEMKYFVKILSNRWGELFAQALYKVERQRQDKLRKPSQLPLEEDLTKLKDYCLSVISELVSDEYKLFELADFVRLRAIVVTRLTVFNARRGGEPARLEIEEWNAAKDGQWIDPQRISEHEQHMLTKYKLAYQAGKGTKDLVPLLIPEDTAKAIEKLIEVRQQIGVDAANKFVFPYTTSLDHVIGWHEMKRVCKEAGISQPKLLTANKIRHRAATAHANKDSTAIEKEAFFRHMGHSKLMDEKVYQCPMGITELCKVGQFLNDLDQFGQAATSTSTFTSVAPADCSALSTSVAPVSCSSLHRAATSTSTFTSVAPADCSALSTSVAPVSCSSLHRDSIRKTRPPKIRKMSVAISDVESSDSEDDATFVPQNDISDSDDINEDNSSTSQLPEKVQVKERKYYRWPINYSDRVKTYFRQFIESTRLPGMSDIRKFKLDNVDIDIPLKTIRTKIMNEQNKFNRLLQRKLDSLAK